MTDEIFQKCKEIHEKKDKIISENKVYQSRIDRIKEYIDFLDGRKAPIEKFGKVYKKVEVIFCIEDPTIEDPRDWFDIASENKDDFMAFLKKTIKNYEKKIEANSAELSKLLKEYEEL